MRTLEPRLTKLEGALLPPRQDGPVAVFAVQISPLWYEGEREEPAKELFEELGVSEPTTWWGNVEGDKFERRYLDELSAKGFTVVVLFSPTACVIRNIDRGTFKGEWGSDEWKESARKFDEERLPAPIEENMFDWPQPEGKFVRMWRAGIVGRSGRPE